MTTAENLIGELRGMETARSKMAVIKYLGRYSSDNVVTALERELNNRNRLVGRAAVEALGRCSNSRAVGILRKQLQSPSETIRAEAILSLGKRLGRDFAEELVSMPIEENEVDVREAVTEVLAKHLDVEGAGRKISEIFLENGTLDVRKATFKALGRCNDDVTRNILVENLIEPPANIINYRYAGEALGKRAARGDEKAFQALVDAIESDNMDSLKGAVAGLKAYGKADALEPLNQALKKTNMEYVKSEIMDAINACHGNAANLEAAKRAVEWVAGMCDSAQPMRVEGNGNTVTLHVFARETTTTESPVPPARKAPIAKPKNPRVVSEKPKKPEPVEVTKAESGEAVSSADYNMSDGDTLATNLYDENSAVRMEAAEKLGNGERNDDTAVLLSGILYDDSPEVKEAVVRSLGEVGTTEAIAPLMQVLADDSVDSKSVETAIQRIMRDSDSESVDKALEQGAQELKRSGSKLGNKSGKILEKLMAKVKKEQETPKSAEVDARKLARDVRHVARINGRGGKRRRKRV